MSQLDKQEPTSQQSVIEDLTVNEGQATEIKGGPVDHTIQVPFHVITNR